MTNQSILKSEPRVMTAHSVITESCFEGQSMQDTKTINPPPPAVVMTWTPRITDPQDIGKITVRLFPHNDDDIGQYWCIVESPSSHELQLPPNTNLNLTPKYPGRFVSCVEWVATEIAQCINYAWRSRWNRSEGKRIKREMVQEALSHIENVYSPGR